MKKFQRFMCNLGLIAAHLIGIAILEAFCAAKLIFDPGWTIGDDVITILAALFVLGIHYFLLRQMLISDMLSKAGLCILIVFDTLVSCSVSVFLICPNDAIRAPIISTHIFIIAIQILILLTRTLCCYFIDKTKK